MYPTRKIRTRFSLVLLLLCSVLVGFLASPQAAQATNCSGNTWPSNGNLQTTNWPGSNEYSVTFQFKLSADELCSLQQTGPYLEIDLQIRNFDVPYQWDNYALTNTNLPGGIHDSAEFDPQYIANPAVTRVYTSQLQASKTYYATISWMASPRSGMSSYIQFIWSPSRGPANPAETALCAVGGGPYCVFGITGKDVWLFGDKTFAGGTPNGALPLDGFRWYEWSPTSSTGGATAGTTTPPPSNVDYRADRTILHAPNRTLYVMAGGAKFYFGSMTEYYAQGHTDSQMTKVPQAPLDLVGDAPGNMPKNGTVVQRPDGSLHMITGGVRWPFGSMAQYYQLGYTNAQMVRVSSSPLDGISDASASHLPADGSLLQGSDATVWVMKDGVRRSFTGAQQVTDLGYSWSNLIRVPDGQLSRIPSGGNL